MKILYHHRTNARDGSAVHIDGLIDALRGLGANVVVVAPPVARARSDTGRLGALRRRLPRWLHELLELAYNVVEVVRLRRAVRTHRPDLIYQRSNVFLLSSAWVATRCSLPRIVEVNAPYALERERYGGMTLKGLGEWTEHAGWRSADAVVAVSGVLASIVQAAGVAAERVHVMPNGVEAAARNEARADPGVCSALGWAHCCVLGFTGYVREWNALDAVIELVARTRGAPLVLLVVGDGPARASLEARARALGVAERVHFTGEVPRDRVASYVAAFDIALQPAANPYASPLKLIEYMAHARAIVAPDQPNIRELLQHGRDAWLFTPDDRASLEAAVLTLVRAPQLRRQLGAGALRTLQQRELSWAHNARRVLVLGEGLLQQRAVGAQRAAALQ